MSRFSFGKYGRLSKQRGFLDALFGGEEDSSSSTTSSQEVTGTRTSTQIGVSTETGLAETEQQAVSRQLGTEVQSTIEELVTNLAASQDAGGFRDKIAEIGQMLFARAASAETSLGNTDAALMARARREGLRQVQSLNTQLAQQAGGTTANSFVAGATAEAMGGLETNLAGLQSQLTRSNRETATKELSNAAAVLTSGAKAGAFDAQGLASLLGVLKGAEVTATTTGTSATTSQRTATEQLMELLSQLTTGTSSTEGSVDTSNPLFAPISTQLRFG